LTGYARGCHGRVRLFLLLLDEATQIARTSFCNCSPLTLANSGELVWSRRDKLRSVRSAASK